MPNPVTRKEQTSGGCRKMTLFVVGLLLSCVSIAIVLRVHRAKRPREYMPLLIESTLPFVLLAFAALPRALPALFQHVLGHSIDADYIVTIASDGMKTTETWYVGRWLEPLHLLALAVAAMGIVWAGWNLIKRASLISNIVALGFGFVWIVAGLMRHLLLAPFD